MTSTDYVKHCNFITKNVKIKAFLYKIIKNFVQKCKNMSIIDKINKNFTKNLPFWQVFILYFTHSLIYISTFFLVKKNCKISHLQFFTLFFNFIFPFKPKCKQYCQHN